MQIRETNWERATEIANTIRKQIGISTLMAVGARDWSFPLNQDGLCFRVNRSNQGQYIDIILNSNDTYDVVYYRIQRKTHNKIVLNSARGIYCDMLSTFVYDFTQKGDIA